MLQSLKNIFQKNQKTGETDSIDDLTILCGLMIEAANTDGNVSQDEVNKILAEATEKEALIITTEKDIVN